MTKYFYRSLYLPGQGMFRELPADLALGRIQVCPPYQASCRRETVTVRNSCTVGQSWLGSPDMAIDGCAKPPAWLSSHADTRQPL